MLSVEVRRESCSCIVLFSGLENLNTCKHFTAEVSLFTTCKVAVVEVNEVVFFGTIYYIIGVISAVAKPL